MASLLPPGPDVIFSAAYFNGVGVPLFQRWQSPTIVFVEQGKVLPRRLPWREDGFESRGRIAQRDGDIAQPAQWPHVTNRRPFGHLQKPRFAPRTAPPAAGMQRARLKSSSSVSCEKRFHGRSADNHHNRKYGCRLVDGTSSGIAPSSSMVIGQAAPGVDGIGLNDGPGGTDGHAGDAAPTLLRNRAVDRQGQINQQFAEEKERSGVAA